MAEPASMVARASAGVLAGAGLAISLPLHPDFTVMSGVLCGALVFVMRSREPSRFRRLLYFAVSLVGGYALTPELHTRLAWLPEWAAAFVSAAGVVTAAVVLLDWSENSVPALLTQLVQRFIGGDRS
ncbi:putative holin [Paraburkholderia caffeinilytica]|uniref:putative holin n=1 Tax=Paraburkholderia caffeinilytica TaxID=1761016 RepID=UPI003DA15FF3